MNGVEAAREFFRDRRTAGDRGDCIEVVGWIRVIRPEGGMSDSQGHWVYRFSGDQLVEADYSPVSVAVA